MAKPSKHVEQDPSVIKIAGVDDSAFSEEQNLGFPPYWNPAVGTGFIARVIRLDDSDPDFQRWVFQADHDLECHSGPKEKDRAGKIVGDAKTVTVKKGEFFSTSAYAQFGNSDSNRGLHEYIDLVVKLVVKGTRDIGQPQPMFVMGCYTDRATAQILSDRRRGILNGTTEPAKQIAASAQ